MKENFKFTMQVAFYAFNNLAFLNPHITMIETETHNLCQRVWFHINNLEFIAYMMGDNMHRIINTADVFSGKFKYIEALTDTGEKILEQYKKQIYATEKMN